MKHAVSLTAVLAMLAIAWNPAVAAEEGVAST